MPEDEVSEEFSVLVRCGIGKTASAGEGRLSDGLARTKIQVARDRLGSERSWALAYIIEF